MNKDNGMWVLKEKISLNCWQLQHDVPVTEIFEFNLRVNFLYFLSNWINLLDISSKSIWKKSKPWKQLSDALEANILT